VLFALSLAAGLLFTVWFDREGGVALLLLRRVPDWAPRIDAVTPSEEIGWIVVMGNENGVRGGDLVRWNAEVGVFVFLIAALLLTVLALQSRRAE
jgi:hypothetical protein